MKITNLENYMYGLIIGAILLLIGLFYPIPGGSLTTYESLNGDYTEYSVFDNKYSSIDEYVGGDAYNYIIGASLVAGKMSGAMTSKAIYITGGAICICYGLTKKQKKENDNKEIFVSNEIQTNTKNEDETV